MLPFPVVIYMGETVKYSYNWQMGLPADALWESSGLLNSKMQFLTNIFYSSDYEICQFITCSFPKINSDNTYITNDSDPLWYALVYWYTETCPFPMWIQKIQMINEEKSDPS